MTSNAHSGIVRAVREVFLGAARQRRVVHLKRDVVSAVPTRECRVAADRALHAVFAQVVPTGVCAIYSAAGRLVSRPCREADAILESAEADALAHLDFPTEHRRACTRTTSRSGPTGK